MQLRYKFGCGNHRFSISRIPRRILIYIYIIRNGDLTCKSSLVTDFRSGVKMLLIDSVFKTSLTDLTDPLQRKEIRHMNDYTGSRWYKCDLHLHTASSICYVNKEDTPDRWVARALEMGLEAVAVTDHNDYRGIAPVMEEAKKQGLAVFPGVEITCDTSKIHILVLFDTGKTADTVRDFLNRCDIDSENIGDPNGTGLGVFEVCTIAKKRGALVIAAHIDEFSSINSMNPANLDKLLDSGLLDAVQVANLPSWRKYLADKDTDALNRTMQEKYGPDATPAEVERWRKCFDRAREAGIPMVAFSDNPCSPDSGRHGLWGIGSAYTWIQMDDSVNLESIRQSLITPESRIRMFYDYPERPKSEPDFWIRSLDVIGTELNPHVPIHLDFHPQLNCIIGGRGSGKSSIVQVLMGVYKQLPSPLMKNTIFRELQYYAPCGEDGHGIFREDSEIRLRFSWYGSQYLLVITDIKGVYDQKQVFYSINPETEELDEEALNELRFNSLMTAQVFADREINEIASVSGSLLEEIDRMIPEMYILKAQKQYYMDGLLNISSELAAAQRFTRNDYRILMELNWLRNLQEQMTMEPQTFDAYSVMIKRRENAAEMIDDVVNRLDLLKTARNQYLEKLDALICSIREVRTDFINKVMDGDANYKIELKPLSSRDSFRKLLADTLKVDLAHIQEDVEKLENALFAKKDGLSKYAGLLKKMEGFSDYFTHLVQDLSVMDRERLLLFRPEDELVLFYHPTGVKRFFPMNNASSGELATAIFTFFLFSGNMPLIIDQPEAGMDNRIIYEEILTKLKKAKEQRQLILVTHNANIASNADAEMIIAMDSGSKFVRVHSCGTMDSDEIRRELCDIIEGTEQAFRQRARKYHIQ